MPGGDQGATEEENSDGKEYDTLEKCATEDQVENSVKDGDPSEGVAEAQDSTKRGAQREAPEPEKDHSVPEDHKAMEKGATEPEQSVSKTDDTLDREATEAQEENSVGKEPETIEKGVEETEEHHLVGEDQDKTEDIMTGGDHDAMERRSPETEEENSVGKHQDTMERESPETEEKHHVAKPDETLAMEATESQEDHSVGSRSETEHQRDHVDAVMEEIASLTLQNENLTDRSAEPSNGDPQASPNNTTQEAPKKNVHMVRVDVHHSVERSDPRSRDQTGAEVERSSFDFLHSCFGLSRLTQIGQEPEGPSRRPVSAGVAVPAEDHVVSEERSGLEDSAETKISRRTVLSASKLIRKLHPVVVVQTTERTAHEGHGYRCALCLETFRGVDEVIEHQHRAHALRFQHVQHCLSCRAYYSCESPAGRHVCGRTTPEPRQGNLACRYCGKPFIKPVAHCKHEQQHRAATSHRCPCCGLYFLSEYKMKAHKRKVRCMPLILDPQEHPSEHHQKMSGLHPQDGGEAPPGLYGCFVKLVDINQSDQTAHPAESEALHSNLKPFQCDLCLKGFKYSWNLEDHQREKCSRERKEKPFRSKCPVCSLSFSSPYNVLRHLQKLCLDEYFRRGKARSGEDKSRYKCPLCPAIFTMSFNCKRHLSNICFRQYKREWLGKEVSRLQEENPSLNLNGFSCKVCTSVFAHASGLYRHMKKHRRALDPVPLPPTNHLGPSDAEEPLSQKPNVKPSFTCQFCDRCFSNVHSLKGHLLVHTGDNPFSCLECGKNFPRRKYLLAHRNVHSSQIQCTVCKKVLPSVGDLLKHRKSHVQKGLLQCPTCPMQFKFPVFYLRHIKIHAKKRPKPVAASVTSDEARVRTDIQKPHKRTSPKDMLDHQLFKQVDDLRCGICHREFPTHEALSKHCLVHLSPAYDNKCTVCVGRWFTSRIALIRHMRLHTGEKPFECPNCGMRFRRKEALQPHQIKCEFKKVPVKEVPKVEPKPANRDKKEKKEVRPIECSYCPRVFSQKGHLLMHERAHAAGSLVQCFKCQTFHKKTKISRHRANCTPGKYGFGGVVGRLSAEPSPQSENPGSDSKVEHTAHETKVTPSSFKDKLKLRCPHCPRRFQFRSYLLRHLRSHLRDGRSAGGPAVGDSAVSASQSKVLRCNICTKTFTKARSLRQHVFIHTDAKPYRCETCECSFSRSDHLKVHQARCRDGKQQLQVRVEKISLDCIGTGWQQTVASPSPPECKACSMQFSNHTQLSRHTAMMHSALRRFPCKTCGKMFSSQGTLKRHNLFVRCKVFLKPAASPTSATGGHSKLLEQMKNRSLNQWRHQCRYCPRRFKMGCQLTSHMRLHTGEKPFACTRCDERFIRKDYLQRHIGKCGGTESAVHSETCSTDSPRRLRGAGGPADDSSSTSSMDFKAKPKTKQPPAAGLSESQRLVAERPFQCPHCNMRFISKCGLVIHIRTHSTAYPLFCKKCNQGFWNKAVYQKHIRKCKDLRKTVQAEGEPENTSAGKVIVFNKGSNTTGTGVLQTQFSCKDQNKVGPKVQPVVNKYQCSECDRSFTDGLRLISHLEAHGREEQSVPRLHRCNRCEQTFRNAGLLQRHLKMQHKETVVNMCPVCNRRFRFPSDLELHKYLHDPNRPFVCGSCSLRYWTAKALNLHQKNAHYSKEPPKTSGPQSPGADPGPPKLFACSLCDRVYSTRSTYLKHHRLKHRTAPETSTELQTESEEQQTSRSESDGGDGAREDLSDSDSDSAPYFPCHVCGKTFRTSESLEDHQKCHLGEKPHECEECGKCFFQLNNLQQHQRSHKSEFQCQKCGKGFVSGFALRKHKNTHLKKRSHRCTKCQLCFTKSSELAEHLLTHREENFPCDVCHETFSCKESREEHRKSHANMEDELPPLIPPVTSAPLVPRQCEVCKVRFQDLEQLAGHVCNPAKERPYPCTDCDQHFLHGSHLKKHQLTHHLSGTRSFQCHTCHLRFSHRTHFLRHLQTHGHKEPPESLPDNQAKPPNAAKPYQAKIYQCPICPESFAQALELANHLSVHAHMCNVCGKTFPTVQQLEAHEQSHLSVATQYECTECGESFLGSEAFRQHRWAHQRRTAPAPSQSPPHKKRALGSLSQVVSLVEEDEEEVDVGEDFCHCPICNKRFSSSISLQEHQRQHHDERPFKCPVCAKGFAKKKYLTKHQLIHNSRPYPCRLCSDSFKTEMALATHQRNNHAQKQACSLCNRTFYSSQDLAQHEASHAQPQRYAALRTVQHACDLCYKSFKELHQLQQHQETHVAQVVYECTECDKAFADFNLLQEHQKSHLVCLGSLQVQDSPVFVIEDPMFE